MIDELLNASASPDSSKNFGRTSVPHPVLGTCQLCVLKAKSKIDGREENVIFLIG